MPAAALALALLTGCGGDPVPSAETAAEKAATTADPQGVRRHTEAAIGDCMKQKGFKYNPSMPPDQKTAEDVKRETGDYQAMRRHREKYGFSVYSLYVYPEDRKSGGMSFANQDPNNPIMMALSSAQLESWRTTRETCYSKAVKELTGRTVSSEIDLYEQAGAMLEQAESRELDGDAQLLDLAGRFGDCLKAKGVRVRSLRPTTVDGAGKAVFMEEMYALGDKQLLDNGADPARVAERGGEKNAPRKGGFLPNLTPEESRPYLAGEIKAALDDLECGKDFYAAFKPRERQIRDRIDREFGYYAGLTS
ncbi:hypothetical protein AB0M44_23850 [Streptosporangium subroseum]|uniref:hypothetical protein n=1 Tax=Streptosporangium subroseum TaxID=106412 RepID=UPI00343E6BCD